MELWRGELLLQDAKSIQGIWPYNFRIFVKIAG
jgi:hypothetical protein